MRTGSNDSSISGGAELKPSSKSQSREGESGLVVFDLVNYGQDIYQEVCATWKLGKSLGIFSEFGDGEIISKLGGTEEEDTKRFTKEKEKASM